MSKLSRCSAHSEPNPSRNWPDRDSHMIKISCDLPIGADITMYRFGHKYVGTGNVTEKLVMEKLVAGIIGDTRRRTQSYTLAQPQYYRIRNLYYVLDVEILYFSAVVPAAGGTVAPSTAAQRKMCWVTTIRVGRRVWRQVSFLGHKFCPQRRWVFFNTTQLLLLEIKADICILNPSDSFLRDRNLNTVLNVEITGQNSMFWEHQAI